ncbi:hypothetical protein EMCRGX_G004757 [Ephydatia muelleri]
MLKNLPNEFHVLRAEHSFLMECLEAVEISRTLYSKNVISMICLESIESQKCRPEQVGKLLEYLRSSQDIKNAFAAFCDSLSSIQALEHIAQRLQEELKKRNESSIHIEEVSKKYTNTKDGVIVEPKSTHEPIPAHFLGTSSFLIPFMDAFEQFEMYLQILLKSKGVNAKMHTIMNPEIFLPDGFIEVLRVTCELTVSPVLYEKMIFEFAEMKMRLLSALKTHEDVLPLMKDYVATVSKYLPNLKTSVEGIKTAEDLLLAIQDLWTTRGVGYIRQMIKGTGCQEAADVLERYINLQIPFIPASSVLVDNVSANMVEVTATIDADSITTEMYTKAKNNVSWALCIPTSALIYSRISKGSIIIHWKLSASSLDYIKSISLKALNVCKPLLLLDGIHKITLGEDFQLVCRESAATVENISGIGLTANPHDKSKISKLIEACRRGDIVLVKSIIDEGISYNCIDEGGVSPLQAATQPELQWEVAEWLLSVGAQNADGIFEMSHSLLKACTTGDTKLVVNILQNNIDTNCRNEDGETPLFLASSHGHKEIVEMLLSSYTDINSRAKNEESALYVACKHGHKEIVDILLAKGANVNLKLNNGATPFLIACQEGHYDIVQKLLRNPTLKLNDTALAGFTALHFASMNGHTNIAKLLISAGLDINQQNPDGATPLYVASETGYAQVVKVLVENHANLNLKLKLTGESALHVAAFRGHSNVALVLITAGCDVNSQANNGSTALFHASQKGHLGVVNALLAAGCNVNLCKEHDAAPLCIASCSGHLNVVHALIGANSDINNQTKDGLTALCYASHHGHLSLVHTLISAGANVNLCSNFKYSALYCASERGHEDIVSLLVAANADINMKNYEGCSPLHAASAFGHTSTVLLLIAAHCDVNVQNKKKSTALMIASYQGYINMVEALIAAGANVNLQNCGQCTALHLASTSEKMEIVKFLCSSGADLNLQCDVTGFTPLHIASLNGNVNIVRTLIAANANVNSKSFANGWTPLMPAVCSGYNDIVLDLCTANADVNVEDNFGKTALAYATMKERSNVVQVLIQFGANINHQLQPEGWTPLMLAAQNGNLEITQLLCSQPDIQLDAIDNFGYTAIDIAKSHHHNLVHEELENRTHMKGRNAPIEVTQSFQNMEIFNQLWSLMIKSVHNSVQLPEVHVVAACA